MTNTLLTSWVTIPLLATSLVAATLIFERLWFWRRIARRQRQLARTVLQTYAQEPQIVVTHLQKNTDLPLARIFLAALTLPDATPEEFRLALESAAQGELPLLQRFATAFNTIVGIAPLLGLLGTILGLVQALSALELGSAGGDSSLAVIAGIGEALLTTAVGLVIAIATLVFANYFQSQYRRQRAFIQETGGQLELLYRRSTRHKITRPRDRAHSNQPYPYP
ncbi:MotA/TolQ/ExbB proton channel family protein [Leptolyngbya iicbica LK]|uniref:MotA/TolQ/ExbB proton channel family protein n=2 Tax=Cyanophyceae TaxID=3028117 RepID=A0A4Q7E723_9CYAN|nr:MotA/TolQ/ExbB proton channel family protein [Leptolyngbya sp. LK]